MPRTIEVDSGLAELLTKWRRARDRRRAAAERCDDDPIAYKVAAGDEDFAAGVLACALDNRVGGAA